MRHLLPGPHCFSFSAQTQPWQTCSFNTTRAATEIENRQALLPSACCFSAEAPTNSCEGGTAMKSSQGQLHCQPSHEPWASCCASAAEATVTLQTSCSGVHLPLSYSQVSERQVYYEGLATSPAPAFHSHRPPVWLRVYTFPSFRPL